MTTTDHDRRHARSHPSHGALRPLGLDDVQITGGLLGAAAGASTAPRASRTSSTGWSARAGSATSTPPRPARCPAAAAAASSPTPRSTSCSRRWPGRSAARTTPTSTRRFRALVGAGSPPPRSPTATSTPTSAGPASAPRYTDLEWGHELYCFGHLFQAAVARARTRPDADDGLLEVARRAADHVVRGVRAGRHRVGLRAPRDRAGARRAGPGHRRAPLRRPGRAVRRAPRAPGRSRDIEFGRAYYQDDVPVRRGDRAARARGAGQLPRRRRGRRRGRDRRRRTCSTR